MRKMLTLSFAALLVCCDPVTLHAEGTLHPRDSAGPRKIRPSDCRPGRDPADLDCCGDKLAVCRLQCTDDYAENGACCICCTASGGAGRSWGRAKMGGGRVKTLNLIGAHNGQP